MTQGAGGTAVRERRTQKQYYGTRMSDPQNNGNRANKETQHKYYLSQVLG